jgi:hypothetical protein
MTEDDYKYKFPMLHVKWEIDDSGFQHVTINISSICPASSNIIAPINLHDRMMLNFYVTQKGNTPLTI